MFNENLMNCNLTDTVKKATVSLSLTDEDTGQKPDIDVFFTV